MEVPVPLVLLILLDFLELWLEDEGDWLWWEMGGGGALILANSDEESAKALVRELCRDPKPRPDKRLPDVSEGAWCCPWSCP